MQATCKLQISMNNPEMSKELRAYMAGIGTTGGKKLKAKKLKENPSYYSDIAKAGWKKRKAVGKPEDNP